MKKTVQNIAPMGQAHATPAARLNAGPGQHTSHRPEAPTGRTIDLNALDAVTRRAVEIVIHRMPPEGRRALIHGANLEAAFDLQPGSLTSPFMAFMEVGRNSISAHRNLEDCAPDGASIRPLSDAASLTLRGISQAHDTRNG